MSKKEDGYKDRIKDVAKRTKATKVTEGRAQHQSEKYKRR